MQCCGSDSWGRRGTGAAGQPVRTGSRCTPLLREVPERRVHWAQGCLIAFGKPGGILGIDVAISEPVALASRRIDERIHTQETMRRRPVASDGMRRCPEAEQDQNCVKAACQAHAFARMGSKI